jgi:hypothetical protein
VNSFNFKHHVHYICIVFIFTSLIASCGGTSNSVVSNPTNTPSTPTTPAQPESGTFIVDSETILSSDGPENGLDAYRLIENLYAVGSIEAPDKYASDHTSVIHILEESDAIVGHHFVFLAHLNEDHNKGVVSDRQRNEIKTYDKSDVSLKGYEGETMQFSWQFKVTSGLELSSKFSHFFQLKAKNFNEDNTNGNDNQPMITLSGAEKDSTGNELQVRYNKGYNADGSSTPDIYLSRVDWDLITDEWLNVSVQATFKEEGSFSISVTRMSDNASIISIDETNIDMYRGNSGEDFVRPKWGIYRSTAERSSLRSEEEQVRFANFTIKKGTVAQ